MQVFNEFGIWRLFPFVRLPVVFFIYGRPSRCKRHRLPTAMNRTSERLLKEHFENDRPGFGSYLDCITRSYGTGLGVLTFTFALVHITQQIVSVRFPAVKRTHLAVSTLAGTTASYLAAKNKVRACQESWALWQEQQKQWWPQIQ